MQFQDAAKGSSVLTPRIIATLPMKLGATLQLRARPIADCIHRATGDATRCDRGRKYPDRATDIGLEGAHCIDGEPATDHDNAEFRIQRERTWIKVDRAHEQELAVGDDG